MELILITTVLKTMIVLIAVAIIFTASQLLRKKGLGRWFNGKSRKTGLPARAIVLRVEEMSVLMGCERVTKLQMQVLPERGRNFVVEIRETLSNADRASIRTGSMVRVRYNPDNTRETYLERE